MVWAVPGAPRGWAGTQHNSAPPGVEKSGVQGVHFIRIGFGNSTTAVARLHGEIITPNLLRKLHPWGNPAYLPVSLGGDTAAWQLEEK